MNAFNMIHIVYTIRLEVKHLSFVRMYEPISNIDLTNRGELLYIFVITIM